MRQRILSLAENSRLDRLFGVLERRGAILAYHGIVPPGTVPPALHATADGIERQLRVFVERGYDFLSLAEFVGRLEKSRSVARCLTVTFDDAYAGVLALLPLLRRMSIPSTMFVPTALIGTARSFWWDLLDRVGSGETGRDALVAFAREAFGVTVSAGDSWDAVRGCIMRSPGGVPDDATVKALEAYVGGPVPEMLRPMTWTELDRWMAWDGADCAPHTRVHPVLPLLSDAAQEAEIGSSYLQLRERYPRALSIIAYPYGLYNAASIRAAHAAGMTAGVTMDRFGVRGGEAALLRIPRIPFGGSSRPERMGLSLTTAARALRRREMPGGYPRLPREGFDREAG